MCGCREKAGNENSQLIRKGENFFERSRRGVSTCEPDSKEGGRPDGGNLRGDPQSDHLVMEARHLSIERHDSEQKPGTGDFVKFSDRKRNKSGKKRSKASPNKHSYTNSAKKKKKEAELRGEGQWKKKNYLLGKKISRT